MVSRLMLNIHKQVDVDIPGSQLNLSISQDGPEGNIYADSGAAQGANLPV